MSIAEKKNKQILVSSALTQVIVQTFTNPFDVVKVRLQNNSKTCHPYPSQCINSSTLSSSSSIKQLSTLNLLTTRNLRERFDISCGCLPYQSNIKAFIYLIKREGVKTLTNGLRQGIVSGIISSTTYFMFYENVRKQVTKFTQNSFWIPLLSSLTARTATTCLVFPFEYWRTLQQSVVGENKVAGYKLGTAIHSGFFALLQRDLIFSCTYWILVENIRAQVKSIMQSNTEGYLDKKSLLISNILAGSISGGFAAFITLPLDNVKTRKQIHPEQYKGKTTLQIIRQMTHDEGIKSLLVGKSQRLTKVTISCAGVLTFYEFFNDLFQKHRWLE